MGQWAIRALAAKPAGRLDRPGLAAIALAPY
jgi:hypothetical protein